MRMQSKYIKDFQFKPTYTKEDMEFIRSANGDTDAIFKEMRKRHPDTTDRTFYRWLEYERNGIDTRNAL